jgi:hypothetical protein
MYLNGMLLGGIFPLQEEGWVFHKMTHLANLFCHFFVGV